MGRPWALIVTALAAATAVAADAPVVLENECLAYAIAPDGANRRFTDKAADADYCHAGGAAPCAWIVAGGRTHRVTAVARSGDRLTLTFAEPKVTATLAIEERPRWIILTVAAVEGTPESLTFLDVPLRLQGRPGEPFAACALALNLRTNVDQLPALQTHLRATAYARFGLVGAGVAIVGVPAKLILPTLRDVITATPDLPKTTASGPWAAGVPFSRGSYLFNFGALTEETADDWIAMAGRLGFDQIDSHGGGSHFFRFGDFALNPSKWPRGWDSMAAVVAKLHAAKVGAIFHTYAFFIDKGSIDVTPVPRKDLAAARSFTLARDLAADAVDVEVRESTADVSTIVGFFVHNSVTLHVDDELITFTGATAAPPFRFTGCARGAHGTRPAPHAAGATARHLKECFGLFVPDPDSPLFGEIAARHAEIINRCDFDGLYLDAIDGSAILAGPEHAWHYASTFVHEIWRHLRKPIGMEMSAMWHHFWQFRSRWQAWDYPSRGHKRFIDLHAAAVDGGLLLPLHLGWWNFHHFAPPQVEPTYPDVIEYLGCKLIGFDAGISMTGAIDAGRLAAVPAFERLAAILGRYERLRRAGRFDETIRARLREPGAEYTLEEHAIDRYRFRPIVYAAHTVESPFERTRSWTANNPFGRQPLKLRVEALMTAGPFDAPDNPVLLRAADGAIGAAVTAAPGVVAELAASTDRVRGEPASMRFAARNEGATDRRGAWAQARATFAPSRDLGSHQAVGLWVHGDGNGELLNVRLESPEHIAYGAIADRYVTVDFTGWRYLALVETESTRHTDYRWPEGQALYHVYRELVNLNCIASVSLWYNDLPPGKQVCCFLESVKALPLVAAAVRRPAITVGGATLSFPVDMPAGSYLECPVLELLGDAGPGACTLFGPRGETLERISREGERPALEHGPNEISVSWEAAEGPPPRLRVTVIATGDPLR